MPSDVLGAFETLDAFETLEVPAEPDAPKDSTSKVVFKYDAPKHVSPLSEMLGIDLGVEMWKMSDSGVA